MLERNGQTEGTAKVSQASALDAGLVVTARYPVRNQAWRCSAEP
jgi:hypothetical protein